LSLVASVRRDGGAYLGPFGSRHAAQQAADAVYEVVPLRQCSRRLSARRASAACALSEMGRCGAPCELAVTPAEYRDQATAAFLDTVAGNPGTLVERLLARIDRLATVHRYEEAARVRARLAALLRAAIRMQRLTALTALTEVVGARRDPRGGWEIALIRYGRLVAAGTSAPTTPPRSTLAVLMATAETVRPGPGPTPCATAEETERVLAWLERPDVRLVECAEGWAFPRAGAARFADLLAQIEAAPRTADPLAAQEDRRPWQGRARQGLTRQGPSAGPPKPGLVSHLLEKTSRQETDSHGRFGR
jgi:DNA polymerase III subunit epsilon